MKSKPRQRTHALALLGLSLFCGTAAAHTGGGAAGGFSEGFLHPFWGLDHLIAMIAVGLWAAQQGGRALWSVPAAFAGATLIGGMLALQGGGLPYVETGIALSVLVLGLLIAAQYRRPAVAAAIAAIFALFHGYAHGLEMPPDLSSMRYVLGVGLATVCLLGVGVLGGSIGRPATRVAGFGIAAAGFALILGA